MRHGCLLRVIVCTAVMTHCTGSHTLASNLLSRVVTLMPTGLDQAAAARRAYRARLPWFLAVLVFVAVMLVTLLIWRPLQTAARDDARLAFEARAKILHSALAQVTLNRDLDQAKWHAFVQMLDLERHYPGLQGLGFAEQVSAEHLPEFIVQARLSSQLQFTLIPAGERDQYVPITYYSATHAVADSSPLGVDLYADPVCRLALQTARDQARIVVTGPLQRVASDADSARVLLFLPVYEGEPIAGSVARKDGTHCVWTC
ncbi:MAG: hypothetical protein CVV05_19870 [Gammaproteobacteria bacterium HGW-Gammaproteobacteria-1]|nr:MAG: hypothetical protein CVV05_19870 [Gammaproteobacteria bacterium HGW-Gammaproteobacteria-1]